MQVNCYSIIHILLQLRVPQVTNTLDDALVQQDVGMDDFSPVLRSGPYARVLQEVRPRTRHIPV